MKAMGALSDLLILDLSRVLAGPYGTMVLSDFGARVIKVEQPGQGDETRAWGPPFTEAGQSAYFLCANRNKESITLNLKHPEGQAIVRALASKADVLVENFKVGTLAAFGLGYDDLQRENPGLIYCAITGYGQYGPYADRPGYDTVIQAQGGLMSITGPFAGEPFKVGVAVVDITAGLYAATSILAALHHRQRSGEGQLIDIALYDVQLSWLANVASAYLVSGRAPQRQGNAHATIVPYQPLRAADGAVMVAVGNDGQFARFCAALSQPAWASDVRFATNPARVAHRELLIPLIEALTEVLPTHALITRLLDAEVPCGPVNDIPTALSDPQATARNMLQYAHHPLTGEVPLVGPAPKLSATPPQIRSAPPQHGEQTALILRELLGYDDERIASLKALGAI